MYIYDDGIIQQRPIYSELLNCSQEKRWCGRHSAIYHPWTFHGELSYFYAYYIYILYTHVIYTYYLTSVNASPDGWYILSRVRSSWTSEYKLNHTLSMSFKYLHIHAMYMNDIDFLFVWKGKIHMVSPQRYGCPAAVGFRCTFCLDLVLQHSWKNTQRDKDGMMIYSL